MSQERSRARRAATQAIYQWQMTGQDAAEIESHFISEHDMAGIDQDYFHELIREIPLHLHELEDHFLGLLDRPIEELDPVERSILRIGTYELEFRLDIPYKVVLNESVELAKSFGAEDGHRYINSILDGVATKLRKDEKSPASKKTKKKQKKSAS